MSSRSQLAILFLVAALIPSVSATVVSSSNHAVNDDPPPVFPTWPFVVHTWPWKQAAEAAWKALNEPVDPSSNTKPALDAIVAGCTVCEEQQCGGTVGFGGSPDENGETTLDAMIIDGVSLQTGAVGALRNVKNAIGVARAIMERTKHTMLVGDQATDFALSMGFPRANLSTPDSIKMWQQWKDEDQCQPNMRKNVLPDPTKSCGPYKPAPMDKLQKNVESELEDRKSLDVNPYNHDTIGIVVIDARGNMAAGTSTNGMNHKIPGRVGDGPIPGAGAWVDSDWGACVGTGDGDILMRFAPCYIAVQNLRAGHTPRQAAEDSLGRIERFSDFAGALVVIDREGNHGAASWKLPFSYTVRTANMNATEIIDIQPGDWMYVQPLGDQRRNAKERARINDEIRKQHAEERQIKLQKERQLELERRQKQTTSRVALE